jgi:CBS domain-containing protein
MSYRYDGELFDDESFEPGELDLPTGPTVGEIMHAPPVLISPDAKVVDAISDMREGRVRAAIVVAGDFPLGVLLEATALQATAQAPSRVSQMRVSSIMARVEHVLLPTDALDFALSKLEIERVTILPVMSETHVPIGILDRADVVAWLSQDAELSSSLESPTPGSRGPGRTLRDAPPDPTCPEAA